MTKAASNMADSDCTKKIHSAERQPMICHRVAFAAALVHSDALTDSTVLFKRLR